MQNIYRETFEQIHASEQLRKEVANVPKQEKAAFRHHIFQGRADCRSVALRWRARSWQWPVPPSGGGLSRSGRRRPAAR